MKTYAILLTLGCSITLAACGGGGGGSNPSLPVTPPAPVQPIVTPTSAPVQTTATATGTVVDFTSNAPLAGIKVATAADTKGAAATQVATTDANGHFSFTKSAGAYFLIIGSDSPTDTRTTLHTIVRLKNGANPLTQPIAPAEPNVTLTSAQTSGNFRLTALNANEQDCLAGANAGRTSINLTTLIPDEYLTENAVAVVQEALAQTTDTPTPLFSGAPFYSAIGGNSKITFSTVEGIVQCSTYTNQLSFTSGNPPFASATNPTNLYFGADSEGNNAASRFYPIGEQMWANDPRN